MGSRLLREALRCLCVEIGWSYAVFWRLIGSNPMHLVWGDGHVVDNRVELLVNDIRTQQAHVLGHGIIGQVAATRNHRWILRDNIHNNKSGTHDLTELNHQFLAGIQTVAAIPVLPHGVLQLGSTQMVMENIEFINHVKNLLSQPEGTSGVRLPDVTPKALADNNQPFEGIPIITSEMLPDKLTMATTSVPVPDAFRPMIHSVCEASLHPNSQFKSRPVGAQRILCSPDNRLIQSANTFVSNAKNQDRYSLLMSGLSSTCLAFSEQHLSMRNIDSWESAKRIEPDTDNDATILLRPHGSIFPDSFADSSVQPFSGRSDAGDNANTLGKFRLLTGGATEPSNVPYANLSNSEAVQVLKQRNHLRSNQGFPTDTSPIHSSINTSAPLLTAVSQKQEKSLIKACDVPSTESDANGLCYRALLSTLQECRLSNSNAFQDNQRYSGDISDSNGTDSSQTKLNIEDNDDSKFPYVFPVQSTAGNDLYDILGPDYKMDSFVGSFDDLLINKNGTSVHEMASDNSTCMAQVDVCTITQSVEDHISGDEMFSAAGTNQLLDAVVSNINSGYIENSNDGVTCKTSIADASSPSVPSQILVASSEQMQGKSSLFPPLMGKSECVGSMEAKSACSLGTKTEDCSHSDGIYKSQINLWVESGQSMHSDNLSSASNKRVDEIGKPNRKRARPGENPRPRPKDRQMIMDRVKELREIVPNGAKCSIDALLEKTIKHMLFLQSVTKHADNLKHIGEPKFIDKEGGMLLKEKFEGGATWAFQVGSQSMTCPIVVEDLNPPRQMLVEMLCEHRGFFLEFADLIRGMGLTILKGVMEAHKDKIWARFAVEADRDVTRMEIFLSLVRLLESTVGCSPVPQGVDNINMSHKMYQSCIVATGTSNHLL